MNEQHTLTQRDTPGCYYSEAGNDEPWTSFTVFGGLRVCATCGAFIGSGYSRGKLGDEAYFCSEHIRVEQENSMNERASARRNGLEFAWNPSEQNYTLQSIDQDTMDYLDSLSQEEMEDREAEEPAMQKCAFCRGYHYVGTMDRCPLYRRPL